MKTFPDPRAAVAPFLAAALVASALSAQQPSIDTIARIDSLFAGRDSGPGCAVGVGRAGAPNLERAYGLASLEYGVRNTPATIFHAASIAKQFTAASVVLLANTGKLSLTDDVRRWVPELPDYGTPITLTQLMQHTSGLRDEAELLWLAGGRDDDPTEEEDVLAPIFRQRALNFPPGSQHLYSNSGYALLALVVRRASGQSLKEFAAERLFAPLGMAHTQFIDNRYTIIPGSASGYRALRGGRWGRAAYLRDAYGEGGLFTTVGDLLQWHSQLRGDGELGRLLREQLGRRAKLASGDSVPYGLGVEIGTFRGNRFLAHGGNASGESGYVMGFPDRGLAVAVLCNGREIDSFTLARRIAGIFIAPLPTAPPRAIESAPVVAVSEARLKELEGLYYDATSLATRTVRARDGRLYWVRGGPGTPLDAVAPDRFRFPPGQPAELYFPEPASGQPREMQVISGGTVTKYHRASPFVAPRRPDDYAGRFRSEEVDVTLTITPADSAIVISVPGSWRFRAEPLFKDAFAIPEAAVIEFVRRRGKVTGIVVDMARSRRIQFTKLP